MRRLTLITCFIIATSFARAELVRENYEGLRPTGMGGAFVAVADDNNALWYNPAGLANIHGVHFDMINVDLGVDSHDTLSRVGDAILNGNYSNLARPDTEFIRLDIRPTLLVPYFGFQIFDGLNSFFDLQNLSSLSASVDVDTYNDIGAIAGMAIPLSPYASIGASARIFERTGTSFHLTAQDLLNVLGTSASNINSAVFTELQKLSGAGWALAGDVGAMVKLPLPKGYPTIRFAAVMDDMGETTFHSLGGIQAPPPVAVSYHFGSSVQYDLRKNSHFLMAFDVRHAFEALPLIKTVHAGIEYAIAPVSFRLGLYEGYPTAGFSLEFPPHTRLILSTYEPELGDALWNRGQRWYLAQLVIGFNPL